MARFRLVLVLSLAAYGCSNHRDLSDADRETDESPQRDAGDDPRPSAGRGGAGAGGRAGAGGEVEQPDSGDAAVSDACAELPNACSDERTTCTGNTLVRCSPDENGCLVETRQNCARGGTNFCDAEQSPPACAVDPCASVSAGCETEGKSCSGATLVECRRNADGCLVATRTDCTDEGENNTCGGEPAACRFDACRDAEGRQKSDVCATESDVCAGNYWVHCVPDADGCPIATRTDCTRESGKNFCNAAAEPPACGFDPCKGVTNCLAAGKSCEGVTLVDCAPNADGCLVRSTTDCTQNQTVSETCDAASGTPACTTCADAAGCTDRAEGDSFCDDNVFQRCSDTDGDTCLNAVREDCGENFSCNPAERCVYSGGDACSSAIAADLREPMSYGPFDTAGAGDDYSSYSCEGLFLGVQATSHDLLFAIDVAPRTVATVSIDSPSGFTGNGPVLLLLARCGDDPEDGELTAEASCESTANESLSYPNGADTSTRVYLVVDANRTNDADNVGTFGLRLDVRPLVCGDGRRDGSEACDDGNLASGDGCTPACMREMGFSCTSGNPSVCTQRPSDGICANVRCPALPSDAPANSQTCCTAEQRCGIAYSLFFGAGCLERDQPGVEGDSCPDEPSVFPTLIPALSGCCRPDGKCGLLLATGAGCVERVEAWADMTDGFGDFLYPGPFLAATCTPE